MIAGLEKPQRFLCLIFQCRPPQFWLGFEGQSQSDHPWVEVLDGVQSGLGGAKWEQEILPWGYRVGWFGLPWAFWLRGPRLSPRLRRHCSRSKSTKWSDCGGRADVLGIDWRLFCPVLDGYWERFCLRTFFSMCRLRFCWWGGCGVLRRIGARGFGRWRCYLLSWCFSAIWFRSWRRWPIRTVLFGWEWWLRRWR